MRIGLYFDLRNPQRWRRDPATLYAEFLELCEEAEGLGIDSVWVTEHHGFDDDYLPAPLTLLAAVAARTSRIRLGTGVVVAPLHRAAAIAEQAAVVDILSAGRLDLGLGAGYRPSEFSLYNVPLPTRYTENDARARQVRELSGHTSWSQSVTSVKVAVGVPPPVATAVSTPPPTSQPVRVTVLPAQAAPSWYTTLDWTPVVPAFPSVVTVAVGETSSIEQPSVT